MTEIFYTQDEIELNKKLYEACGRKIINIAEVEELLKQGADPLGPYEAQFQFDHLYGELVCEQSVENSINLPLITELFLRHGMDINNPRVPYDQDDSINPMWGFTFCPNGNSIKAIKLLLDNGVNTKLIDEYLDHCMIDYVTLDEDDPNDPEWHDNYVWLVKTFMLLASYRDVIERSTFLKEIIDYDKNMYDLTFFEKWDDFIYEFDTSVCESKPRFYKTVIKIFDKNTNKLVWKMLMN